MRQTQENTGKYQDSQILFLLFLQHQLCAYVATALVWGWA